MSLQIPHTFEEPAFKKYTNCSTLNTNVKMYCKKVTFQFRFSTKSTNTCKQQILGVLTSQHNKM